MNLPAENRYALEQYRNRAYLPQLDGLRAVCVLGVISSHMADKTAWAWLSGGLGVNVFFVLSGYLITMLALKEERHYGMLSLWAFYIRRTFRIFPLYYFVLGFYCVLLFATSWGSELRSNFADSIPYYLTYLQEIPYAFEVIGADKPSPFAHAWSLGIEEKYYLVWPLLAFGLWAWRPLARLRGTLVLLFGFTAMQSVGRLGPSIAAWRPEITLYPYSNILWGCLLALLLDDPRWFKRLKALGSPIGTAACLAAYLITQFAYHPLNETFREIVILHGIASTALIGSILTGGGAVARFLQVKPAVFVGRISYGMYLIHGLGISAGQKLIRPGSERIELTVLAFALSALVTIIGAYGLAITIERPLLRFGRRWSDRILNKARPLPPQTLYELELETKEERRDKPAAEPMPAEVVNQAHADRDPLWR